MRIGQVEDSGKYPYGLFRQEVVDNSIQLPQMGSHKVMWHIR